MNSNPGTTIEFAEETAQILSAEKVTMSFTARAVMLATVVVPFLGLIAAIVFFWGRGISWVEIAIFLGMTLPPGFGVTVGFHRLFTHRSFATFPFVKFIFAVLGSMSAQGPLMMWVAFHRMHHQHSDNHGDPHSPHNHGNGVFDVLLGLWHAHVGWMFQAAQSDFTPYVKDLYQNRTLRTINILFPLWVFLGLLIPTAVGYFVLGGWVGACLGFIWGGLVRIFAGHHVTWSVNSICHVWGSQPFPSRDESRNNFLIGILGLGEGWHNNHHAFPTSARHGIRWWEIDASYGLIRLLEWLGLAWDVKQPGVIAKSARSQKAA